MKKVNLLLTFLVVGFLGLVLSAIMFFSEHKEINDIYTEQSSLGHELVEVRDNVTLNSIGDISNPYDLNLKIVDLMRRVRTLASREDAEEARLIIFKDDTQSVLMDFYDSASEVSLTLEHLVGVIVARESVFSSIGTRDDSYKFIINQFVSHDLVRGLDYEQQQYANILVDLLEQQKAYLSVLLSHENVEFVEMGEKRLLELAHKARDWSAIATFSAFLLVVCAGGVLTHQRKLELEENNRLYKEAAEKTAEATKAKSLFLATMSHELRTPMNGVLGIAQLIADSTNEVETKRLVKTIMESGEHLVTILNDILDFSKAEQGKMTIESSMFSFDTIIESIEVAMKPLAAKKNIALHFANQIPPNAQIEGDPARVRQILFNLVGNAIKFTQQGGVTVDIVADTVKGGVKIKILDTGVGIDRGRLDIIFKPFEQADLSTTRKFGGTGLGLSIVKQLIDAMGGEINVFSQVNVGTEFTIRLPMKIAFVKQDNTEVADAKSEPSAPKLKRLRILIAEDNKVSALVHRKMCEEDGHTVVCVDDGIKAIEALKKSNYHLVLMDNHMPNLGGVEAIKIIRQDLKLDVCIFACTADVFKQAHEEFINAGANYVLTKPLQFSSFKKAVISKQAIIMAHEMVSNPNVVCISRLPTTELPLTEEELSSCKLFRGDTEGELLQNILETLISDFDKNIEVIISSVANNSPNDLFVALHSIKGMALELGLKHIATLSASNETVARAGLMPGSEELQMLVNLLLVNSHHAQRLLAEKGISGGAR